MRHRALLAAGLALGAVALPAHAHADPQCPADGCPHGTADGPPPADINSPSYKDGYKSEHDFFAIPQNHAYLASEMKNGYTATLACQVEVRGGSVPANPNDWMAGCVEALHDLGFKP